MNKNSGEKIGARVVENSVQTHVIKLLGREEEAKNEHNSTIRKSMVQNEVRFYRNFYKSLCAHEYNSEGDKVFVYFIKNNETLISSFAKTKGRDELYERLKKLYERQKETGERLCDTKWKELESNANTIIRGDAEREYEIYRFENVVDEGKSIASFFKKLDSKWKKMMICYSRILEILLDSEFPIKNISDKLKEGFELKKTKYEELKRNKLKSYIYERDNIYLNLYLYARGRYIKYFYIDLIPDFSLFKDIVNYEYTLKKEYYSLKDVAKTYAIMLGRTEEDGWKKVYQNITKQFQKLNYVEKFKEVPKSIFYFNVEWAIPGNHEEHINYDIRHEELGEVLTTYMFFKRKNYREEDYREEELEGLLRDVYGRLLDCIVKYGEHSKAVEVVKEIGDYYRKEFHEIFDRSDRDYQEDILEALFGGLERIFTLSIGAPQGAVYGYSIEEVRKLVTSKPLNRSERKDPTENFDFGDLKPQELENIKQDDESENIR